MKLYNIYETIIFEETNKGLKILSEGVSESDVISAIDGKYNVSITYRSKKDYPPTRRYIQVYNLGITKAGNLAIRAFQITGQSKTGRRVGFWKMFRLDRIESWTPRIGNKWVRSASDRLPNIPKYNPNGDRSMISVKNKADVTQKLKWKPKKPKQQTPATPEQNPIESPIQPTTNF
jgi:predicted DNA-binding transcriptional regulator YafY